MNCAEYRRLFAEAIRGRTPDRPLVPSYQAHLAQCPKCQSLFTSASAIKVAVEDAASNTGFDSVESDDRLIQRVRRRGLRRSTGLQVVAALALVAACLVGVATRGSPRLPPRPQTDEEPWAFARDLGTPDGTFVQACSLDGVTGGVLLKYAVQDRSRFAAIVKQVLLSAFDRSPQLQWLIVSVEDSSGGYLQGGAFREEIDRLRREGADLPPSRFLGLLQMVSMSATAPED